MATVAEFGDSLTFLRQCGQGLRRPPPLTPPSPDGLGEKFLATPLGGTDVGCDEIETD